QDSICKRESDLSVQLFCMQRSSFLDRVVYIFAEFVALDKQVAGFRGDSGFCDTLVRGPLVLFPTEFVADRDTRHYRQSMKVFVARLTNSQEDLTCRFEVRVIGKYNDRMPDSFSVPGVRRVQLAGLVPLSSPSDDVVKRQACFQAVNQLEKNVFKVVIPSTIPDTYVQIEKLKNWLANCSVSDLSACLDHFGRRELTSSVILKSLLDMIPKEFEG
ncbi:MAG: hypothetical protein ACK528_03975, partial [Alphaproteobacteria bacterium]